MHREAISTNRICLGGLCNDLTTTLPTTPVSRLNDVVARESYLWYASGVKISVSLPSEDVEFLDSYGESLGYDSRSAVVRSAVRMLRSSKLGAAYAEAWQEWEQSGDADIWDTTATDGLG